jgi:uncharacterized membrane-anchored protein
MLATLKDLWWKSSILLTVFFIAAAFISPPDTVSQITLVAGMGVVYGVVFLIVRRFEWFKRAPETRKRSIAVVACLFAIFVGFCTVFIPRVLSSRPEQAEQIPAADRSEKAVE